jgi:hypothetical protein
MISAQFELHLCMRQEAELSTDILGDSNLPLAGDLHRNTSTGKGNTISPSSVVGYFEFFGKCLRARRSAPIVKAAAKIPAISDVVPALIKRAAATRNTTKARKNAVAA